jgi:hypothetical protein
MQPSQFKLIEIKHHRCKDHQIVFFKLRNSTLIQKIITPRPVAQTTTSSTFTFIPLLSEGGAGETWKHSNRVMLFLPPCNRMSLTFTFIFDSAVISYLFLANQVYAFVLSRVGVTIDGVWIDEQID